MLVALCMGMPGYSEGPHISKKKAPAKTAVRKAAFLRKMVLHLSVKKTASALRQTGGRYLNTVSEIRVYNGQHSQHVSWKL